MYPASLYFKMEMNITEDILEKYRCSRKQIFLARLAYLSKNNRKNRFMLRDRFEQFKKRQKNIRNRSSLQKEKARIKRNLAFFEQSAIKRAQSASTQKVVIKEPQKGHLNEAQEPPTKAQIYIKFKKQLAKQKKAIRRICPLYN